jgi:hypothetical protein
MQKSRAIKPLSDHRLLNARASATACPSSIAPDQMPPCLIDDPTISASASS